MMWRISSLGEQWAGEAVGVPAILIWSDSLPWWEERGKQSSVLETAWAFPQLILGQEEAFVGWEMGETLHHWLTGKD